MSGVVLPSGTVTFLFTDIEGSTPYWDSFPESMGAALARHDEIVRSAIEARGGHVFSTGGDGFGVVFGRAADAVAAALAAQRDLADEEWPAGAVLRVRMGLHTGEAEERDGDFFGPSVIQAARIMGAANGGQVLVSDLTVGLIAQMSELRFVDLGTVELKGLVRPVHLFGVAGGGHEWVDTALHVGQTGRGNLPRLQTESVGDLAALRRRVGDLSEASVVTLSGSGGVGKTRAAVEIGWLVIDEFADGVWLVELAPVTDPDMAAAAIASSLGARLQPGATVVESIVEWCVGRSMLLIIDNCEHVLGSVATVVQAIASACVGVTVIATSREPLGIPGETVVRVPSLDQRDGVELFVLRARSADAVFEPTDADKEAIVAICRRLDGIPLAIELAAARARALDPGEILDRLSDRFRLMRGSGRGVVERHQTLRATVAWSYQLLPPDAQLLFDRLAVFAGTFNLAAAEAVCAGDPLGEFEVVDLLVELVDKSMVMARRSPYGTRYQLLETMRQYGEERLDDRSETAEVRDRHLHHYVAVGGTLDSIWHSPAAADLRDQFDDDWDDLGAAHAWAITTGDIDRAHELVATTASIAGQQLRREHRHWCVDTLELADQTGRHDVSTICCQAWWELFDSNPDRTVVLGERATALDEDDPLGRIVTLHGQMAQGHTDRAVEIAAQLRSMLPSLTDMGVPGRRVDRFETALAILSVWDRMRITADAERALAIARSIGAPAHIADALRNGVVRWLIADPPDFDRALADLNEAVHHRESVGAQSTYDRLGLTRVLNLAGDPRALDTLHDTLQRAYDQRWWAAVDATLHTATAMLAQDTPAIAEAISGYLAGSTSQGDSDNTPAVDAINHLQSLDDADIHRAREAAMDRHQVVGLVLQALDLDPESAPS